VSYPCSMMWGVNERWAVEDFEALTPGPEAAVVLGRVVPGRLGGAVLVAWAAAQARQVAHEEARLMVGLSAVVDVLDAPRFLVPSPGDRWGGREELRDLAADEVAAAMCWTTTAAGGRIDLALAVVKRLPGLHEAMLAGRVDYPKVKMMVDGVDSLSEAKARAVIDSLLDKVGGRTSAQLRPMLRRRVAKADPAAAGRKRDKTIAGRTLALYPDGDGTATLSLRGVPVHRAEQALGRVHAIATAIKDRGDGRLLDQIRSDVTLDLLQGIPIPGPDGQDGGKEPTTGASRQDGGKEPTVGAGGQDGGKEPTTGAGGQDRGNEPTVGAGGPGTEFIVPLTTVLRLADEPGMWGTWGPILADAARDAVAAIRKAPWRLTVTHPTTGVAIWSGSTRRRPSVEDLDYVRARDRTCRIAHCNRPAVHCQIDHNVERQDGGATNPCNLGPLCPKHHRRKSRRLWDVKQVGDGHFESRSPLGAVYHVQPEPVDDLWDLPDDLYDWTEEAEFAEWTATVPPPEPHWAMAIDRPDEPEFRHDEDTYWLGLNHSYG
jgi:hypothetical protein